MLIVVNVINRGKLYLLFLGEYQTFIYFIECGEKISIFHHMRWNIFRICQKKSKFSFYFILNENTESTTYLFPWSFLVRFDFCIVFIAYNIRLRKMA